jgi:hypothetical protein
VIVDKAAPCTPRPVLHVARPPRTASPSVARAGGVVHASTIVELAMLPLGTRGLTEIINDVRTSWRKLLEVLLLALSALAFLTMRARSCDRRFAWRLSASVNQPGDCSEFSFVSTAGTAQQPVELRGELICGCACG